jgi:hypothetical protein
MIPFTSFVEWRWVDKNVNGDTFNVNFEKIKKHGGYIYYCELQDY